MLKTFLGNLLFGQFKNVQKPFFLKKVSNFREKTIQTGPITNRFFPKCLAPKFLRS